MGFRVILRQTGLAAILGAASLALAGCGTTVLSAPLPAAPGLNLEQLRDIQRDPTLTADQKRAAIREAINVPDTPGGNRIANFLLNLFIP